MCDIYSVIHFMRLAIKAFRISIQKATTFLKILDILVKTLAFNNVIIGPNESTMREHMQLTLP